MSTQLIQARMIPSASTAGGTRPTLNPTKEQKITMKTRILVTAILLMAVLVSLPAQQVTKVGTTAAKFLSIPVGARAVGMGGAFVAVSNDASALYWNPAGLARLSQSEALFAHSEWIADMSFNYGGITFPLEGLGQLGISFTSLTMADMERTTVDQPEGTGELFSAGSFAVGVSYGRNLTEWFSIGGTVKYVNEHIWNSSAVGLGVDLGTLFTTPFSGLRFGAAISNYGQKMKIQGDDLLVQKDISSNAGNNPNINANLTTDDFDLPLILRIGLAYDAISTEDKQFTLVADAVHPNDNSESISFGGEFTGINRMLSLRGGYMALGAKDSEEEFTLGGGVNYKLEGGLAFKFDYAYQKFGRLENVHKFAVSILF